MGVSKVIVGIKKVAPSAEVRKVQIPVGLVRSKSALRVKQTAVLSIPRTPKANNRGVKLSFMDKFK